MKSGFAFIGTKGEAESVNEHISPQGECHVAQVFKTGRKSDEDTKQEEIECEKAFKECIDQIVERTKKFKVDKIAAIESRGFVFASAVSYILNKPFILLRKKNKLPAESHSVDFELEYGTATVSYTHLTLPTNAKV